MFQRTHATFEHVSGLLRMYIYTYKKNFWEYLPWFWRQWGEDPDRGSRVLWNCLEPTHKSPHCWRHRPCLHGAREGRARNTHELNSRTCSLNIDSERRHRRFAQHRMCSLNVDSEITQNRALAHFQPHSRKSLDLILEIRVMSSYPYPQSRTPSISHPRRCCLLDIGALF